MKINGHFQTTPRMSLKSQQRDVNLTNLTSVLPGKQSGSQNVST